MDALQANVVLRHLCRLATKRDTRQQADAELLARFIARRYEQLARAGTVTTVMDETTHAACHFAAGKVSGPAAALAEGGMRALGFARVKLAATLVLVLGVLAVGAGFTALQLREDPPRVKQAEAPKPLPPVPDPRKDEIETKILTDRYGDRLPAGVIARLGTVRFRHDGGVNQISFSPDGKLLAAATSGNSIYLWETVTGKEFRRLKGVTTGYAVAFAPDGKWLAVAGHDGLRLLDPATGASLSRWQSGEEYVRFFVFSPDGKILASLDMQNTVRFLDVETGKELFKLNGPRNYAPSMLAFSPDANTFAYLRKDESVVHLFPGVFPRRNNLGGGDRRRFTRPEVSPPLLGYGHRQGDSEVRRA